MELSCRAANHHIGVLIHGRWNRIQIQQRGETQIGYISRPRYRRRSADTEISIQVRGRWRVDWLAGGAKAMHKVRLPQHRSELVMAWE